MKECKPEGDTKYIYVFMNLYIFKKKFKTNHVFGKIKSDRPGF